MAWTAPFTATTGAVILSSDWNTSGRDDLNYLKDREDNPPRANVYHNATQSLTSGVALNLAMNSEYNDAAGQHDNATNNSRLTVPAGEGGWYIYTAFVEFAASATGQRHLFHQVNATTTFSYQALDAAASGVTRLGVAGLIGMTAAQYVETWASQNSGGALNVAANPYFAGQRVA